MLFAGLIGGRRSPHRSQAGPRSRCDCGRSRAEGPAAGRAGRRERRSRRCARGSPAPVRRSSRWIPTVGARMGSRCGLRGWPQVRAAPGCYGAAGAFVGKVPVSVDGRTLVFRFPARARPAGALVARATRAFRSAAERRLRGAACLEPAEQGGRRVHARASEPPRVPNSRRRRRDHHRVTALGPRTRRQVGAVASGSDPATRADLGRPRYERVSARDDADDVRRVVPQADRPGVVHAAPRPPHVASAEPAHDRAGALHDASLHEASTQLARSKPEMPGDDHALDFIGALADLQDLLVAVEPRDRVLVHVAVAAVDLEGPVRRPGSRARRCRASPAPRRARSRGPDP